MTLVRPTDLASVVPAINAIIDQLERQARGEQAIVTDPKVLGSWIQQSGVTLGKLATSYTDAPPGYSVALGTFTASVNISAGTNTSEGTAVTLVSASAFTADGSRPVIVTFFAPQISNSGIASNRIRLFLTDNGVAQGQLAQVTLPSTTFGGLGPVTAASRYLPAAGSRTLAVLAYTLDSSASVSAGSGGSGAFLPGLLRVDVY